MTADQQNTFNQLQAAVTAAQNAVNIESLDYNNNRTYWIGAGNAPGGYYNGQNNQYWEQAMNASAASLATKQGILAAAQNALSDFTRVIAAQEELAFKADNPEAFAAIEKSKIAAQADIQKNADNKILMQGTTKYLIIGAVVLVIVCVGIWYFRKKYKGA